VTGKAGDRLLMSIDAPPPSLDWTDAMHGRADQLATLKQGPPDYMSIHPLGRAVGVGQWEGSGPQGILCVRAA